MVITSKRSAGVSTTDPSRYYRPSRRYGVGFEAGQQMRANVSGIAIVLLERLTRKIIPRAKRIQERLAGGEQLDHWDRQFLEELIRMPNESNL
ncbi:hypothetical protein [Methylomonas koyamae]|uniref:hypothetical protein n=1 Tax=Methylomonas koyamae TaxID=702114 RepID=UPI0018D4C32B|nr:hypothetical protein [Methylomonas koyamae]